MTGMKRRLAESDDRMTMHVVTVPSPVVTQALAAAGADSVLIDMEHGAVGHAEAHAMIAAVAGTGCAPIARVAEIDEAVGNIEEICAVEGIDLIVPAMFDLSTDLGRMGQFDHPDVRTGMAKVEAAALAAGIPLGNVGLSGKPARKLFARGCRVVAGFDLLWLKAKAKAKAAEAQGWGEAVKR